jgi:hypothetical protein
VENKTVITPCECPVNVLTFPPVEISHSLIVLSSLPDRIYLPSGEKATEKTLSECPLKTLFFSSIVSDGIRISLFLLTFNKG